MALTLTLTEDNDALFLGTDPISIPLVYDASNTHDLRWQYGGDAKPGGVRPVWHEPDEAEPTLIDSIQQLGEAFFRIDARSTIDPNLNAMIEVQRLLDQAERYHLQGGVYSKEARVYLNVQRSGSTNATQFDVIRGEIDTSGQYDAASQLNDIIKGATIRLTLAPVGRGTPFSMTNYLNNPAMLFADASGNLPAGWSLLTTGGTPSTSLSTTDSVIGGKSCIILAGAASQGIYQDLGAAPSSTNAAAYVWCYVASGVWRVGIYDATAVSMVSSVTIDSTDSGGNSDNSLVINGNTWYRVAVTGSVTSGNTIHLIVDSSGGAATGNFDAAYYEHGTATVPDGWMSSRNIDNRGDQTTTNHTRVNWVDVSLIPGDAPAKVSYQFASSNARQFVAGHMTEGRHPIYKAKHWLESGDMSASGGQWSTSTGSTFGANYTGANWYSYNDNDSEGTATISGSLGGSTSSLQATNAQSWQIYAMMGVGNVAITCTVNLVYTSITLSLGSVTLPGTAAWYALPLGIVHPATLTRRLTQFGQSDAWDTFTVQLQFDVSGGTYGANCIGVDALMLLPVTDGKVSARFPSQQTVFAINGEVDGVAAGGNSSPENDALVDMWTLTPGRKVNRFIPLLWTGTTRSYDSTEESTMTVYVLPQTRNLFGTI